MKKYLLPLVFLLVAFAPPMEDAPVQVHQFESEVGEHTPMWWTPVGFPFPFAQVKFHFIKVPTPTTLIKSINITLTDELYTKFGAQSWLNQYLDLRVFTTKAHTTVSIRGASTGRLGHESTKLGTYELFDVPYGELLETDVSYHENVINIRITDPKVIDYVNSNTEDNIVLKVRSFSTYNLDFLHPIFIHRLFTTSQIKGELTYYLK